MSTTLVNVGILNGRSTKLDSDDLYSLCELIESCTSDVLVTTPEIVVAETSVATPHAAEAAHRVDTPHARVRPTSTIPDPDLSESSVASESQLAAVDLAEKKFDVDEAALLKSLGIQSDAKVDLPDSHAAKDIAGEISSTTDDQSASTTQPSASQIIERAKQAAIETAMLAAANSAAMLQSALPVPKARVESKPRVETAGESASDATVETTSKTEQKQQSETALPETSSANEQLSRDNVFVEEISSALATKLSDEDKTFAASAKGERTTPVAILPPTEKQYERLVENLLEKTVPGLPAAMMFTSCEQDARVGRVTTGIAALLAEKELGRILLIDGNLVDKSLTDALTDTHDTGLTEVLNREQSVSQTVIHSGMDNLYFMPAGIAPLSREKSLNSRLAGLTDELRNEYRFIVIDGGNSTESVARTWSSFCESTYLVVSTGSTDTAKATTAVTQLQASGARLLGCVVAT